MPVRSQRVRIAGATIPTIRALLLQLLLALLLTASSAHSQGDSSLTVSPSFGATKYVAQDAPIEIMLSRAPRPGSERIAIVVGAADLTALFERRGRTLIFRGDGVRLPAGETEVKVYLAGGATWTEIGRFPLRVLTRGGFERAAFDPTLALHNKGQLGAGQSGSAPVPDRATYQDATATLGFQSALAREGWTLQAQANVQGVTNRREALRYGTLGDEAAVIDLTDYTLRVEGPGAQLTLGQVAFGQNRHLINSFGSRGFTAAWTRGPVALNLGTMNGSSVVGWENISGLSDDAHRVSAASLAIEALPNRPGAAHIDVAMLNGSLRPITGFAAGGIVDSERSDGFGVQVGTSTPAQRLRAAAGFTQSSFANGSDAELLGGGANAQARKLRKAARWAEAAVGLVSGAMVTPIASTVNATLRHERVDPLFRSVGAATQSDVERNAYELAGNIDAVAFQATHTRSNDNLDALASMLTTLTRQTGATLSMPIATLFRVTGAPWLLPTLNIGRQETHQFGRALPANADFSASHVPDQLSVSDEATVQWQASRWRLSYRANRSRQDNRQAGREAADLSASSDNVGIGISPFTGLDVQLELGNERQENMELQQVTATRRTSLSGNWSAAGTTTVDFFVSASRMENGSPSNTSALDDARLGVSRSVRLWPSADGVPQGQLFIRIARQSTALTQVVDPLLAPPTQRGASWTASSGLSLRLFQGAAR